MSKLRIKDAPTLPDVDGSEKIPTGGKGDYSVTLDQVKTFARGGLPQQIEDHINDTNNPHQVTKDQVGLGNADNTSDLDKPISTKTQEALDLKPNTVDVDNALNLKANIEDVNAALNLKADKNYVDEQDNLKLDKSEKGVSGGLATLDDGGKVPRTELPDFVDLGTTVPTYKTVSDGVNPITGVVEGAYFNVRSEDDDTVVIEYQNVGGVPTPSGKSYPSSLAISNVENAVIEVSDNLTRKTQELKTLSDFDDDLSLALQQSNAVISGGMKTIELTSIISKTDVSNLTLRDVIIDCSAITNSTGNAKRIISFSGSEGTSKYATQDALYNQNKFYCDTSGLVSGDLVFIQADNIINASTVKPCQYSRVISVGADHVVLDIDMIYDFTVANNARINNVIPCTGITLSNVKFIGAQAGLQNAVYFDKCEDCHVDVKVNEIDYAGVEFRQSLNCTATGTYTDAQAVGLSYGVAIMSGCQNVRVVDSFGEDLRHHVTIGGNLINNYCGAYLNHARNCRDAGYDSHPASYAATFLGNTVECTRGEIQPKDGVISQGLNSTIKGNTVIGAYIRSIVAESYAPLGVKNNAVIHDNDCQNSGSPSSATSANIHVYAKAAGGFESASIQLNTTDGGMEFAVWVQAELGDINNLSILNNPKLKSSLYNIFLDARTGKKITGFGIKDNTTFDGGVDIMCQGVGKSITDGVISNNRLRGGDIYNIRLIECDDVEEYNNKCSSASSRRLQVESSTNITPATNNTAIRTTTGSNIVTTVEDYYIVVNRPSGTSNLILYDASQFKMRELILKNKTAQSIVASAPIEQMDGTMSTAIITGTGIVRLRSNGSTWFIA